MLKKSWLDRLSAAARWRLGAKEGSEVIADYREIVGDPLRPDEVLYQELGKPRDAVKPLTDQKTYRIWLAVFAVLAACILMLGISPLGIGVYLWMWLFVNRLFGLQLAPFVAAVGAVVALVWFRRREVKTARLPKAVPVLLAVCLAVIAGVLLFCWALVRDYEGFAAAWGEMPAWIGPDRMVSRSLHLSMDAMIYSAPLLAVMGVCAMVKARTEDRRWAAVYVLALAALMVSLETVAVVSNMRSLIDDVLPQVLRGDLVLATLGLIGTGVALC